MARLSNEERKRAVTLYLKGCSVVQICRRLKDENIVISHQALYKVMRMFCTGALYQPRRQERKITEGSVNNLITFLDLSRHSFARHRGSLTHEALLLIHEHCILASTDLRVSTRVPLMCSKSLDEHSSTFGMWKSLDEHSTLVQSSCTRQ